MLRAHHIVSAAIGLTGNDRDLRYGTFGVGVEQLGTVLDDAAVFLRRARHEARHVNEGDNRNIEGITEAHEARSFDRGLDIQTACQNEWLVGDDTNRAAFHTTKADDDVLGVIRLDLEEVTVIYSLDDQFFHVIRLVRVGRYQRVE